MSDESDVLTDGLCSRRYLDAVGFRLCDSQELYLHSRAFDGGCHAQGCEDAAEVGMGYWEEKA